MLKILDREWKVRKATISGVLQDKTWIETSGNELELPYFWVIEIDTNGMTFDEEYWQPSIEINTLTKPNDWKEFDGFTYQWQKPEGIFCVFGYELIRNGNLTLTHKSNNVFRLELSGLCDVDWDDDYGQNVPFSVSCNAEFTGITASIQNDKSDNTVETTVLEHLKQFINIENIQLTDKHPDYIVFAPRTPDFKGVV